MHRIAPAVLLAIVLQACAPVAVGPNSTPGPSGDPSPVVSSLDPTAPAEATPAPNVQDGVASQEGLFIGSWASVPPTPPINVVHEWVLHLETPDGEPIEGAAVSLNGDMPAHGHGMPTQPQVTADLGGGDYRVEGMSFQMGGYWVVDVTVTADGQTDLIRFGLDL
jgi:hypothetical protein